MPLDVRWMHGLDTRKQEQDIDIEREETMVRPRVALEQQTLQSVMKYAGMIE